jgi:hypothetical protein
MHPTPSPQGGPEFRIGGQSAHGNDQFSNVAGSHKVSLLTVGEFLGYSVHPGRDNGMPGCHAFENHKRKGIRADGRMDQHIQCLHPRTDIVGERFEADNVLQFLMGDLLLKERSHVALADEDKTSLGMRGPELCSGGKKLELPLAARQRIHAHNAKHHRVRSPSQGLSKGVGFGGAATGKPFDIDAAIDLEDAGGISLKFGSKDPLDRLGNGDNPGAFQQKPAAETPRTGHQVSRDEDPRAASGQTGSHDGRPVVTPLMDVKDVGIDPGYSPAEGGDRFPPEGTAGWEGLDIDGKLAGAGFPAIARSHDKSDLTALFLKSPGQFKGLGIHSTPIEKRIGLNDAQRTIQGWKCPESSVRVKKIRTLPPSTNRPCPGADILVCRPAEFPVGEAEPLPDPSHPSDSWAKASPWGDL